MTMDPSNRTKSGNQCEIRLLVFAGEFSTTLDDRWLLDDIVDELAAQGAVVDVIVFDNNRPRPRGVSVRNGGRVRVISVGPERRPRRFALKAWNYLYSAWLMHTKVYRLVGRARYDLALFTSVGIMTAGVPARLKANGKVEKLLFVLWDFFPVHQVEIGRLPGTSWVESLRHAEYLSFARADVVAVMTPANSSFLAAYHPRYRGRVILLPPWAQSFTEDESTGRQTTVFTAIFGGQLVAGRGVETLLHAARSLDLRGSRIRIVIAGEGPLRGGLESMARSLGLSNVTFLGALPRPEYRELLKTAHVGIAATVAGVSVPSFPSKIVEYCRASLPVVACLEEATDAGKILLQSGAGASVPANDEEALAAALENMEAQHRSGELHVMSKAARSLFDSTLSATHAARTILAECSENPTSPRATVVECEHRDR